MRIVDIREVLSATELKKSPAAVDAIVGRTLGDVSVEELMQAAQSVKHDDEILASEVVPLREVYLETEEE